MRYFSQMLLQAVALTGLSTYINAQREPVVAAFQALQGCRVGCSSDASLTASPLSQRPPPSSLSRLSRRSGRVDGIRITSTAIRQSSRGPPGGGEGSEVIYAGRPDGCVYTGRAR